jgi:hypothetical protein
MTNPRPSFDRTPLPKRFCNLDRLLHALEVRGLDGIVATLPYNVYYLTGFNAVAHKSDEPRPYAVLCSSWRTTISRRSSPSRRGSRTSGRSGPS